MIRLLALLAAVLLPAPVLALTLSGDTRWQGAIDFAETVRVESDAVLTVAPGTLVTFRGGGLEVAGRLQADGARFTGQDWDGIVLKGCGAETLLHDCIVEGARTGILVRGGQPRLEGLTLTDNGVGMELRQKTDASVSGCSFRNNAKVGLFVKDEATAAVIGSRFEGNGRFGAYIYRALPRRFSGNVLAGNPTGLMVSHFGSDPRIEGNRFEQNGLGILVDRAAKPVLAGNLLRGNGTGIRLYRRSDPRVEGNRLEGNEVGVSVAFSSYPLLVGNDLAGNGTALLLEFQSSDWERAQGSVAREAQASARGAFGQSSRSEVTEDERRPRQLSGTVDARGNWWGTDGTSELARIGSEGNPSFIEDGRDTPTFVDAGKSYPLDRALFAPWSGKPLTTDTIDTP